MTSYSLFEVMLPRDSTLPERSYDSASCTDPRPLSCPAPAPRSAEESRAISIWLTAHQAFFLSLNIGTWVARRAFGHAQRGDLDVLAKELERLAVLRRVHTALPVDSVAQSVLLRGKRAYEEATRFWWTHHARIMLKLIKEPYSLARLEYERQQREGGRHLSFAEFKQTLRTPAALAENDDFFGVKRGAISLQQFQHTFRCVLDRVLPYQDQTAELPQIFSQGRAEMERILDEVLGSKSTGALTRGQKISKTKSPLRGDFINFPFPDGNYLDGDS